jgi:hypothetical protein
MKLISKQLKMNPDTFAPELEVVIRLPMEVAQDDTAVAGDEEFQSKLGKELFELLAAK